MTVRTDDNQLPGWIPRCGGAPTGPSKQSHCPRGKPDPDGGQTGGRPKPNLCEPGQIHLPRRSGGSPKNECGNGAEHVAWQNEDGADLPPDRRFCGHIITILCQRQENWHPLVPGQFFLVIYPQVPQGCGSNPSRRKLRHLIFYIWFSKRRWPARESEAEGTIQFSQGPFGE